MGNQLTEGHKNRLKNNIIQGAQNYEKYLRDKCFQVICEDGTKTYVRFFHADFKHLSGIQSDLDESDFYKKCVECKLNTGNILTNQKYGWDTLKGKAKRLANIHELLYQDTEKRLLLNQLKTNTYVFPIAIRNDEINSCIGFVSAAHKARSLRKAGSSNNYADSKKIVAILRKENQYETFDEFVYIEKNQNLLNICPDILQDVSEEIQKLLTT